MLVNIPVPSGDEVTVIPTLSVAPATKLRLGSIPASFFRIRENPTAASLINHGHSSDGH
jgi:hypothetical protein